MVQKRNLHSDITKQLIKGPMNMTQLAVVLNCNRNSLQKELKRMCENNILRKEKNGNETIYGINSDYSDAEANMFEDILYLRVVDEILDSIIAKKYDAKKINYNKWGLKSKALDYLFKLEKIRPVFTITNDVDGYGIMNRIDRDEIVKETGRTSWFTFKTNPKAKKPFKFIIDLMDYCITKSIGATFVEVFYPHDTQNDLGVKARKEVQKLGFSIALKIKNHLFSSDDPKFERCYTMYLHHHSSLLINLQDWLTDPELSKRESRTLPDTELEELTDKLWKVHFEKKGV